MMLTEEQAKTKRCQESFSNAYLSPDGTTKMAGPAGYSTVMQSSPINCLGSGCMAWRWCVRPDEDEWLHAGLCYQYRFQEKSPGPEWELCTDPQEMDEVGNTWRTRAFAVGYCGKAGKP